MNSEFYLFFVVYLENAVAEYTLQTKEGLFYKFIEQLKSQSQYEVELHTTWEDTVENDGIKYAKIRNSYFVKDFKGSDYEIAYRFSYCKLDEEDLPYV